MIVKVNIASIRFCIRLLRRLFTLFVPEKSELILVTLLVRTQMFNTGLYVCCTHNVQTGTGCSECCRSKSNWATLFTGKGLGKPYFRKNKLRIAPFFSAFLWPYQISFSYSYVYI